MMADVMASYDLVMASLTLCTRRLYRNYPVPTTSSIGWHDQTGKYFQRARLPVKYLIQFLSMLPSVLHAAARLALRWRIFDHIFSSHLNKPQRATLTYKNRFLYIVCTLVHNCLHNTTPLYLSGFCFPESTLTVSDRQSSLSSKWISVSSNSRKITFGPRNYAVCGPSFWHVSTEMD